MGIIFLGWFWQISNKCIIDRIDFYVFPSDSAIENYTQLPSQILGSSRNFPYGVASKCNRVRRC